MARYWRERVHATDGKTEDAHVSPYEGSSESVTHAAKPISVSFDLLGETLPPICKQLSTTLILDLDVKVASFAGVKSSIDLAKAKGAHLTSVELVGKMKVAVGLLREHRNKREHQRPSPVDLAFTIGMLSEF